jgi:hypothetical protein
VTTDSNPSVNLTNHIVVFDVNVYLDVATLLGSPFSWEKLQRAAAQLAGAGAPVPHRDPRCDSLRAISVCSSGRLAGFSHPLQVWTSPHIDALVRHKAVQADDEAAYPEDRGLGWEARAAQGLVDDLIWGIVERTGGDTVGMHYPFGNPPLDHEDGMVYGACKEAAGGDVLCERYCVTNDQEFISADLPGYARVMSPATFVRLVRSARFRLSTAAMKPVPPV